MNDSEQLSGHTDRQRAAHSFFPGKKTEPMKDMLEGNQSGSSANSWLQRKHRQRSGKKETEQRKSATPGGVFPSLLFFLGFSPTQASRIFQQHVGLRRMIQKEIQVLLLTNNPTSTDSAVWKLSQALNRNTQERRNNTPKPVFLF